MSNLQLERQVLAWLRAKTEELTLHARKAPREPHATAATRTEAPALLNELIRQASVGLAPPTRQAAADAAAAAIGAETSGDAADEAADQADEDMAQLSLIDSKEGTAAHSRQRSRRLGCRMARLSTQRPRLRCQWKASRQVAQLTPQPKRQSRRGRPLRGLRPR